MRTETLTPARCRRVRGIAPVILAVAVLAVTVLAAGITMRPVAAAAAEASASACAEKLESVRLWIRATNPNAPPAERAKVTDAVAETNRVCQAALKADPDNGALLTHAAYALFAADDQAGGIALAKRAAANGYPPALVMMARHLSRGEVVEKDVEGAWTMLLEALESDDMSAQIEAALEFMPGGAGPESRTRVDKAFAALIEAGSSEAMIAYAMKVLHLESAKTGDAAATEGLALLKRAADEEGDGLAMIYLSLLYNQGEVVPRDEAKAIAYAERAIEAGVVRAHATMGQIYQNQDDPRRAADWFRRGAEAGDGFSQGMLGFMYSGGFGVDQDMDKAVEWWTKGRWSGDRLSAGYLQVHREHEAARKAAEAADKSSPKK